MKKRIACLLLQTPLSGRELEQLARSCAHLSPQIALRPTNAVFLEIGAMHNLYSEESVSDELLRLARPLGGGSVAVAGSASRAYVLARYPHVMETEWPLEALYDLATPFGADPELEKKITKMNESLHSLGISNVHQLNLLPKPTLASRFGAEALELIGRLRGTMDPPWPAFRVQEAIAERIEIEGIEPGIEPLLFVLRGVLDKIMNRLATRSERASVLKIEFEMVRWNTGRMSGKFKTREWTLPLPVAQGSSSGVLPILRDYLSQQFQKRPLEAPLQAIRIEVLESTPGGGSQPHFFEKREQEGESWQALIGRLIHELGAENVFQARAQERYLPENAWSRELPHPLDKPASQTKTRRFSRPSRLLKKPEPLSRVGNLISHPNGSQWHACKWLGPERISTEWWSGTHSDAPQERDYFKLVTQSGEILWVYLDPESKLGKLYLHGFFD